MRSFSEHIVEKYILGVEETVTIEGVGKLAAKLDTGNGAYCVLHGDNIQMGGDQVSFSPVDGVTISRPVEETITINLGAGNTEERPVVKMNMKIGSRVFRDVLFSIGDRSTNLHKVLISKSFIQDDLDAAIDVSLKNAAARDIQVNY